MLWMCIWRLCHKIFRYLTAQIKSLNNQTMHHGSNISHQNICFLAVVYINLSISFTLTCFHKNCFLQQPTCKTLSWRSRGNAAIKLVVCQVNPSQCHRLLNKQHCADIRTTTWKVWVNSLVSWIECKVELSSTRGSIDQKLVIRQFQLADNRSPKTYPGGISV